MTPVAIFSRVSRKNLQNNDRQIFELKEYARKNEYNVVAVIAEEISGVKSEREGINQLYQLVHSKQIDKVLVHEVSRIGRNPSQVLKILEDFTEAKVSIYSQNFGMETLTPQKKLNPAASLIFTIYAELGRTEREQLRDRILSGLAAAKRKGKLLGRKTGTQETNKAFLDKYPHAIRRLKEGHSLRNTCKLSNISLNTARKLKSMISAA